MAYSFENRLAIGDETQNQRRDAQADGDLDAAQTKIEGKLVFLIVPLIAQHQNAQRFQEEAPHHAERVRFAQQVNIAAAEDDGGDLQEHDHVDDAEGGAETLVRLAEPIQQDAVFGHAIQNAVGADDGGVHGARQNQHAHDHDENVKRQLEQFGADQMHRQAAQQVVGKRLRISEGLMIMPANTVMTPVQITAYQQTMLAVIFRFFIFG